MSSNPVHTCCQNCDTALQGPYCHHCGQHDFDVSRSFHHVFLDALENFFHFDAKFFRNVVTLLVRPGELSASYNAGRRVSQMPPFRLYLFISVLFFFVSFLGGHSVIKLADAGPGISHPVTTGSAEHPGTRPAASHLAGGRDESFWTEKINHFSEHQEQVVEELAHAFPKILIFCLPVFALLTRFLFRSAGQTYLQHLVIAVHFHTFVFLWKTVGDGWAELFNLFSTGLGAVTTRWSPCGFCFIRC